MKQRNIVVLAVAGVVALTVCGVVTAAARTSFGDGTHLVGKEIRPGTYRTKGTSSCYWARLKNFSGSLNAIAANNNASGPEVVTIARTDKGFESSRCGTWSSNLSRITKSKTRFGQGTFIVGVDVAPGTYRARGAGCYWARLKGFNGELSAIIANGNASGSVIVTIAPGDRGFTSSRCGTWTRI